MKAIAISKLVPGQEYSVDGQMLTFLGTRFERSKSTKMDSTPVKFSSAMFGDRWVFANSSNKEVEYKKGFDVNQKPGLVPVSGGIAVVKTAKIVA
ncbi:hypothetical protein UFOVP71_170 [uncultured Caudovirales phage]|uniref:Uncharacterized protein n=1 Tax=uncultured Caudovirales phage TaxID=2100421 RepID=A0A6J5T9X8_9CAUD|nr:hypothetical protein UFOVP71_170 [uncultured Caudovirales phage]